ncbi:MAG: LPS export ABC transporter periplasmic protein LptC [Treponema sp.]|nr:LPS export ABC transporter periplasmic protein LptC [Treponema sp.]
MKRKTGTERPRGVFLFALVLVSLSCTFDYGVPSSEEGTLPDIEMDRVEYTRVRGGEPQVRFRAEKAERWEERQIMELERFSFEQFANNGDINARGSAGTASVELDSGNIDLGNGISMEVLSEDLTIKTERLDWKDGERILSGPGDEEVVITRPDGTLFQGSGITVHTRERTWEFAGGAGGSYVEDDEDGEDGEDDEDGADDGETGPGMEEPS